ncbi:MAG: lysine-sensitive aspartokinase 3 [Balneolaceae bacterium]
MPDLIKVAKFGGTSMADYTAMTRCASIIKKDPDKKVIVVSATAGTTNLLTGLSNTENPDDRIIYLDQIRDKHDSILKKLKKTADIQPEVDKLLSELENMASFKGEFSLKQKDQLLSIGERLSSTIFTGVLNEAGMSAAWFDARKIIKTDDNYGSAEPDIEAIKQACEDKISHKLKDHRIVTQGFIGSDPEGFTTTLGRGGSDYSAALIAEGIHADVLEIWTDVSAVFTTDPRLVPEAKPITEISFNEAAELSVFGAKVLHPATLKPAIRKNIKVYVGSSIHPDEPGTWIVKNTREKPVIRAISVRRNQTLLTVHSLDMLHRHGFLARLFQILAEYKISVDLVTTSEVNVSLTLDTDIMAPGRNYLSESIIAKLKEFSDVTVERELSLIALVGNNLHTTSGLSGPVFSALEDINIRLICHGASQHNLCFLVEENKAKEVVSILHQRFILTVPEKFSGT